MARNAEKAQSMLFRFQEQQAADMGIIDAGRTHRPRNVSSVTSVGQCEKWRSQVVKEISRKVAKLQDPALNDYQLRDLNDEVNKLMKEKFAWEAHLKELGGPNYLRVKTAVDREAMMYNGQALPQSKGYKYFGRARELPGVKELFEAQAKQAQKQKEREQERIRRNEVLNMDLDASYYGFGTETDDLLKQEEEFQRIPPQISQQDARAPFVELKDLVVPSHDQIEHYLVQRRKQQLEQQYLD